MIKEAPEYEHKVTMTKCLNCNQPLPEHFCAHCGQKASTHRYSIKHFIEHDLVHGVWHVDKGLLFTLKELFTRPGHSIRSFVEGRRAGYFNCITLLFFVLGAGLFLGGFSDLHLTDIVPERSRAAMSVIEELSTKYPKLIPIFTIPLSSVFSFLWFRKARLNGTEHLVLNAYKTAGELAIALLFNIIIIFYHNKSMLYPLYNVIGLLAMVYSVWFYYQYFSVYGYKKYSLFLRSLMIPFSTSLLYLLLGIIAAILTYKK